MYVFLVYSPKDYDAALEEQLMLLTNAQCLYVVKEYGKKGGHPHLNVLYQTNVRPDNLRQQAYRKAGIPSRDMPRLICCKTKKPCQLPQNANYVLKEVQHEVLYQHPAHDLEALSQQYLDTGVDIVRAMTEPFSLESVSEEQCIGMALEYFSSIDVNSGNFRLFQTVLVKRLVYVRRPNWNRIYSYICTFYDVDPDQDFPRLLEV